MDITPQDVQGRAQATKLAATERAAEVAYAIRHPWYRCQALTSAAEAEPNRARAMNLIGDAFRAAQEQDEINRIVTVASGPLKICTRLSPETAEVKVRELIELASKEPHTLRRSDALHAIVSAVKGTPALRAQVLPSLVDSLTLGRGWRIERLIADVALVAKHDHPEFIPRLIAATVRIARSVSSSWNWVLHRLPN